MLLKSYLYIYDILRVFDSSFSVPVYDLGEWMDLGKLFNAYNTTFSSDLTLVSVLIYCASA